MKPFTLLLDKHGLTIQAVKKGTTWRVVYAEVHSSLSNLVFKYTEDNESGTMTIGTITMRLLPDMVRESLVDFNKYMGQYKMMMNDAVKRGEDSLVVK